MFTVSDISLNPPCTYFAAKLLPGFFFWVTLLLRFLHALFFPQMPTSKSFLLEHTVTKRKNCSFSPDSAKWQGKMWNIVVQFDRIAYWQTDFISFCIANVNFGNICSAYSILHHSNNHVLLSVFLVPFCVSVFFLFCGHCSKRRKVFLSKQI